MTRLEGLDITDFSGGLHLEDTFGHVAPNESPRMENVVVDNRGGFSQRKGLSRWNAADVVTPASWDPRSAEIIQLADGTYQVYVSNGSTVYVSGSTATFSDLSVTVGATPHLADFAPWGDVMYIAAGKGNSTIKRDGTSAAATLSDPAVASGWNDDYTTPAGGYMPEAECITTHQSYIFVANLEEDATEYPNRIRWSHPDQPEDWAENDFLDIEPGGGYITGIIPFDDHLLIFKPNSVWRLFGYDLTSWQLERVTQSVGCPHPQALTRSQDAVYFFSASGRKGVYAYTGGQARTATGLISEKLDKAMNDLIDSDDVWVSWADRRLNVSVPWNYDDEGSSATNNLFVWDPYAGREGAWTFFSAARGSMRRVVELSDIAFEGPLVMITGLTTGDTAAALCEMTDDDTPYDYLVDAATTAERFHSEYRTGWFSGGADMQGWPERRKSWLRPRFVHQLTSSDSEVALDVLADYEAGSSVRSFDLTLSGADSAVWNAFNWGDGSLWNAEPEGTKLARVPGSFGVWRSIQMRWYTPSSASTDTSWKIDAIFLKYVLRRFTT